MAARVSASSVKEIVETSLTDDTVLAHMVDTANLYIDTHLLGAGHSDAILTKIELFLAAHLVALTEERGALTRSKMGDADESYASMYGEGFRMTRYGQTALILDTSGVLAGLGITNAKAEFRVI